MTPRDREGDRRFSCSNQTQNAAVGLLKHLVMILMRLRRFLQEELTPFRVLKWKSWGPVCMQYADDSRETGPTMLLLPLLTTIVLSACFFSCAACAATASFSLFFFSGLYFTTTWNVFYQSLSSCATPTVLARSTRTIWSKS